MSLEEFYSYKSLYCKKLIIHSSECDEHGGCWSCIIWHVMDVSALRH